MRPKVRGVLGFAGRLTPAAILTGLCVALFGCFPLYLVVPGYDEPALVERHYREAAEEGVQAARKAERAGDIELAFSGYQHASSMYGLLGEYQKALTYASKELELAKGEELLQLAHADLGGLYDSLSHYDKARFHYEEALKVKQDPVGPPEMGMRQMRTLRIHLGLGQVYSSSGDWKKAIEQFERALELYKRYPWYSPRPWSSYTKRRFVGAYVGDLIIDFELQSLHLSTYSSKLRLI